MKFHRSLVSVISLSLPLSLVCCSSVRKSEAPVPRDDAREEQESTAPKEAAQSTPDSKETSARIAIEQAVSAKDRSAEDRALDPQRKPAETLAFFQIAPGDRVAELAAGGGYTAELLARVVGENGKVYGSNNAFILDRFAEKPWSERLKKPVMKNVTRVDAELQTPLPEDATELDAVLMVLFYHDTVWFETDRKKMLAAIYASLKPGGIFGIVDHSAKAGAGLTEVKTLHRIEESLVKEEIIRAGFVLDAEADFLRNPADARDWNASPSAAGDRRGESDRFVLRFIKPLAPETRPEPQTSPEASEAVTCTEPRKNMCTFDYRPVCATVDTGIRCIKAPCDSSEQKTFSNGCSACAEEKVLSYTPGACEEPSK